VRGPPDVHVMFTRSEDGERSRRRKGIARNMLRGESCGGCSCGDRDRAALGFEFEWAFGFAAAAGRIVDGDDGDDAARGASRTCCRRRAIGGGDSLGEGDEEVVVVVLAWAASSAGLAGLGLDCASGEEGETAMPKGVSSIFTLEEDATFLVAGWCIRGDCAAARALSLRWCCADRWLMGGTVRNCPEVDIGATGLVFDAGSVRAAGSKWILYVEARVWGEVRTKHVVSWALRDAQKSMHNPPSLRGIASDLRPHSIC
jgi:hypothetical protein